MAPRNAHSCKHGHELKDNTYSYVSLKRGYVVECKTCVTRKNTRRAKQLRENHLWRKFKLTSKEYDQMLLEQDGKCAICGTVDPKGMGTFHIDHDHVTKKVRKLLCMHCNSALGYAQDSSDILRKMADYLDSFKADGPL